MTLLFVFVVVLFLLSPPAVYCSYSLWLVDIHEAGEHGRHKFLPKNLNDKLVLTTLQGNTATCARAFTNEFKYRRTSGDTT